MQYFYLLIASLFSGILLSCNTNFKDNNSHTTKATRALQDSLFAKEGFGVLREIDTMICADQGIRNFQEWGTADTAIIAVMKADLKVHGLLNDSLQSPDFSGLLPHEKDSVSEVMTALQEKHTKRMVAILSRYGYPNSKRFGEPEWCGTDPFLLLHHPAPSYKDTLLKLLNRETAYGFIDSASVAIIEWDLNGREGIPKMIPKGVEIVFRKPADKALYSKKVVPAVLQTGE